MSCQNLVIITTLQHRQKLWCSQSEKLCSSDIISISISKVLDVLYKLAPPSREHRETWGPGERWLTLHKFSWLFLNRRATTTRHTHGGCLACVEDQYFYWDLLKSQKIFSVCHELPFGHLILSIGLIVNGCCPNRESSLISASKCWTNTSPADHLLKHLEPIMCGGRASPASSGRQIRIAH